MKKQYLFRAYDKSGKEWQYDYIGAECSDSFFYGAIKGNDSCLDYKSFSIYTGIDDVDGVKIFDGDVLLSRDRYNDSEASYLVCFRAGSFGLEQIDDLNIDDIKYPVGLPFLFRMTSNGGIPIFITKVIGNIYEGEFKGKIKRNKE